MRPAGVVITAAMLFAAATAFSQENAPPQEQAAADTQGGRNSWGLDIMASNGGFGAGLFFRRELSPDLSWFTTLSIAEAKDDREIERIDPWTGMTYTPGKLSRFLVIPLVGGIQYRLFREEIVETFRPFVNAAVGPTIVYAMPYQTLTHGADGYVDVEQVDFFKAIGRGQAHHTVGGYVGFGANFGPERGSVFSVNFRYYLVYLLSGALPSTYNLYTGEIAGTKKEFGGIAITISFGSSF
jgi:hypothetical protein